MSEYSGQHLTIVFDFTMFQAVTGFWTQLLGVLLSTFVVFSVLCRFRFANVKPSWVTLQVSVMAMAIWLGYTLASGYGNNRDLLGLSLISLALFMTKNRWATSPPEIASE